MPHDTIPQPWHDFLHEVDAALVEPITLHCIGGFVVCVRYGLERPTNDIDYFSIEPIDSDAALMEVAGEGTALARRFGLYFQHVPIITLPESYADRLTEIFPHAFRNLHLMVPDPYDLALSKLERNIQRDRDDVAFLALAVPLQGRVLKDRYEQELRPYLANEARHDLTLKLWLESYFRE